jgi:serine/threonine protein kinase
MPGRGRTLGAYELVRQIGRGGMAVVYLARQTTLDRDVALKELSSFHAQSPDMAQRFLRESRLAGSLNHPNIVTVLEYFEHEGTPYIAMEYVPRGSLRPYVGQLSFPQLVGMLEGVLSGLDHAGSAGIVHRDLKPENLMVTSDGRVKITDFGIAKATESAMSASFATASGMTVGTPAYMAPEQALAQSVGLWTDLYSVGVMAWEHVVGRPPFHATEAPMAVLLRHIQEEIPDVHEIDPTANRELSQWIARLLVKEPARRTQSPAQAWEDLEEIAIGQLGPRWRREARLPTHAATVGTPPPLTPAPFESRYITFGPGGAEPTPTPKPMASQFVELTDSADLPSAPVTGPDRAAPPDEQTAPTPIHEPPVEPTRESDGLAPHPARRPPISRRAAPLSGIAAVVAVAAVVILVASGGSSPGRHNATTPAAGVESAVVQIPAGNVTANPSFEAGLSGWDTSGSRLSRLRAPDAPNGHYVVRVSAVDPSGDYAIDDDPDSVAHSLAHHRYVAQAWVKGTAATDGKLICVGLRERGGSGDELVGQAYGGETISSARYRDVRVAYVAKGTGNRIDVHLFSGRASGSAGDAFLADAISLRQGAGSRPSPGC